MNDKQQTAVDLMFQRAMFVLPMFSIDARRGLKETYEQAKEMEKEQMWEYIKKNYCIGHRSLEFHLLEFEQYFEETYGGNKWKHPFKH